MARDAEFYLNRALERFNAGLDCEARRKEALSDVNGAYEYERQIVMKAALAARVDKGDRYEMPEAVEAVYWGMPGYPHQFNDKKVALIRAAFGDKLDDVIKRIDALVEMRAQIKAAPVNPAPVKEMDPREARARAKIEDIMAKRQADYVEALELAEIFGGLPVHVNAHIVHGHKGAVFWRYFYYLRGKFVALNVILAAADELKRREEANAV